MEKILKEAKCKVECIINAIAWCEIISDEKTDGYIIGCRDIIECIELGKNIQEIKEYCNIVIIGRSLQVRDWEYKGNNTKLNNFKEGYFNALNELLD